MKRARRGKVVATSSPAMLRFSTILAAERGPPKVAFKEDYLACII